MKRILYFAGLLLWSSVCSVSAVLAASLPTQTVTAEIHTENGQGYFRLRLPLPAGVTETRPILEVQNDSPELFLVHATVEASDGAAPTDDAQTRMIQVVGRYRSCGPQHLTLQHRPALGSFAPLLRLNFTLPQEEVRNDEVRSAWALQQQSVMRSQGNDSLAFYWNQVIAPLYSLPPTTPYGFRSASVRRGPPDLYSIFSGAAAIEESLQLQRFSDSRDNGDGPEPETVPLSSLTSPQVKSHPFDEMLQGRTPDLPPLAASIPADQYGVFFRDIDKELAFTDLLAEWGGTLLQQVTPSGQDYRVQEKLTHQLCLETGKLTRLFGHRVVASMAMTGHDPYLREGSDLTVLFALKNPERFRRQIEDRFAAAVAAGAQPIQLALAGAPVSAVLTPDRSISAYAYFGEKIAAISNSPMALERVLALQQGGPSLASSEDFRYMRTIFPEGATEEDLFIYLSDPHIRALTGPRNKIGEARRLRCAANLSFYGNAALWYRNERGYAPSYEDLRQGSYLGKVPPSCPDHGSYTIATDGIPVCSVHNRLGRLTPLAEIPLSQVTASEAREYGNFVENYNRYWRQFFDPIGIRIKLGETVRIETCILPLIENSWYDGLITLSGRTPAQLDPVPQLERTVMTVRGEFDRKVMQQSHLVRELRDQLSLRLDWIGSEFSLSLCDGQPLFTPGGPGLGMIFSNGRGRGAETLVLGYLASALNLPTYLTVKVDDPQRAALELPRLLQVLADRMTQEGGGEAFSLDTYALEHDGPQPIYVLGANLFLARIRLYAAVVGDRLVIASQRDILAELMDTDSKVDKPVTANFDLEITRGAFRQLGETVNRDYQEKVRLSCMHNLPLTGALLKGLEVPATEVVPTVKALRGYRPYCPSGGEYLLDPDKGYPVCSVHGPRFRQRQPNEEDRSSATLRLVNDLERVKARLAFTPEGLMTTVEIIRK